MSAAVIYTFDRATWERGQAWALLWASYQLSAQHAPHVNPFRKTHSATAWAWTGPALTLGVSLHARPL